MPDQKIKGLKELEDLLIAGSGGAAKVGTLEGRVALAALCGYADARTLVFYRETYGLPLSLAAIKVKKWGLKIDFRGLRYELERIGKKPETIESELAEVRFFIDSAKEDVAA